MSISSHDVHADERVEQVAPVVQCTSAGRTFGTGTQAVVAVHSVTCTVPAKARIALTGPSGSGKSTLLHMMAGLETPDAGSVTWPGLAGEPAGRPGLVGVVFQGPSLIPPLNVVENVALPLVLVGRGEGAAESLALAALQQLDIADLAQRLPDELSGGQAQRVAVARVLAGRPTLILADEPTGQLDQRNGQLVIDVLLQVAADIDAAVVVSTHDPRIAARLEHTWLLRDGALLAGQPTHVGTA